MLREITVSAQKRMEHRYQNAPAEVAHLRNLHSHVFMVDLTIEVTHNDRELEFLMVEQWLKKSLGAFDTAARLSQDTQFSCEMLATDLICMAKKEFGDLRRYKCRVSEDGIVSATVTTEDEFDRWERKTSELISQLADEWWAAKGRQVRGKKPSGYMNGLRRALQIVLGTDAAANKQASRNLEIGELESDDDPEPAFDASSMLTKHEFLTHVHDSIVEAIRSIDITVHNNCVSEVKYDETEPEEYVEATIDWIAADVLQKLQIAEQDTQVRGQKKRLSTEDWRAMGRVDALHDMRRTLQAQRERIVEEVTE